MLLHYSNSCTGLMTCDASPGTLSDQETQPAPHQPGEGVIEPPHPLTGEGGTAPPQPFTGGHCMSLAGSTVSQPIT